MSFDRSIPITFSNASEHSPNTRFDPNDPHYLYQERKKSRILQRSMSGVIQEPSAPAPPAVVLQGDPNDPHTLLRAVFQYYCRFGRTSTQGCTENTLDNVNFAKFCRECPNLLGSNFTRVDVDLTFCKVKFKGERRITYAMFPEALGVMALKKFPNAFAYNSSIVVSYASRTSPKNPPRSPLSSSSPDLPNTAILIDKAQMSLEQYQRQVNMVESLADKSGLSPFEVQDLEDRIKFCYMLQDEVSIFLHDLPRAHEAYRRMCREVELLSINLEAAVKTMAKLQIQRSSNMEESPRGKENAALRKLFPNGPGLSVQEAMKKIMQAELDRVAGFVQQKAIGHSPSKSETNIRLEDVSLLTIDDELLSLVTSFRVCGMSEKPPLSPVDPEPGPSYEMDAIKYLEEANRDFEEYKRQANSSLLNDAAHLYIKARRAISNSQATSNDSRSTGQISLQDELEALAGQLLPVYWKHIQDTFASDSKISMDQLATYLKCNPSEDAWQLYYSTRASCFNGLALTTVDSFGTMCESWLKEDTTIVTESSMFRDTEKDILDYKQLQQITSLLEKVYINTWRTIVEKRFREFLLDVNWWMDKSTTQTMQLPFVIFEQPPENHSRPMAMPAAHPTQASNSFLPYLANGTGSPTGYHRASFRFTMSSPRNEKPSNVDILLANPRQHGAWNQVVVAANQFSTKSLPPMLSNGLYVYLSELETVRNRCKNKLRVEMKACVGWNVVALTSRPMESPQCWMDATIDSYRKDDNHCQVILGHTGALHETWLPLDTHIRLAPSDPRCRIHSGKRWLALVNEINATIRKASSSCIECFQETIQDILWSELATSFRPLDFILSRYLRTAITEACQRDFVCDSRVVGQFNSMTGVYGHNVRILEHCHRARCEAIATIMDDVTETIEICVRSGAHTEIIRLFVQVFNEEISSFLQIMITSVAEGDTVALEALIESSMGLGKLMQTWRHHIRSKLQLDTDNTALSIHWAKDTSRRIEKSIELTAHTLLRYIHNEWRMECTSSYFPNVMEHSWTSVKPYFSDTRITAGVQCLVFRVNMLVKRIIDASTTLLDSSVAIHPAQCLGWHLVLHGLSSFAVLYKSLQPSRARLDQFKIDVIYFICGIYRIRKSLQTLGTSSDTATWISKCDADILELLHVLALLFAPCGCIVHEFTTEPTTQCLGTTELVDSQMQALNGLCEMHGDTKLKPWQFHCLLLDGDPKIIKEVELLWAELLSSCLFVMPRDTILSWLKKRKEMCGSVYPDLTPEQIQGKQHIDEVIAMLGLVNSNAPSN